MKLLNYQTPGDQDSHFGLLLNESVVSFATLQQRFNRAHPELSDMEAYLRSHPESEKIAQELASMAAEKWAEFEIDAHVLHNVKILPPVPRPPALIDFALAPEHLFNSGYTLAHHEKKWPVSAIIRAVLRNEFRKNKHRAEFNCYKGNHNAIIGDGDTTIWPSFTSYLDVEAELAFVVGNASRGASEKEVKSAIAGYTIFNDFSARDVQWPELMGRLGLARCKDFDRGNGIGPFLITPDEVPDPLSLNVRVKVGERYEWKGNTSGYTAHPVEVLEYLTSFQKVFPGTIVGMGTVPGCCGLDRDEWLLPGDLIEIAFDELGTLRQLIPSRITLSGPSRWGRRPELERFLVER
ncbi:MAG: fumarylacetoacetate hydrolase family protein [Desulfomonile sp.]|nr:fumarylacetoacetate hydrolase family protein [Desulfomonile sp.]